MSTSDGGTSAASELLELKRELARTRHELEEKRQKAVAISAELHKSIEFQTATSDVLGVISRSPTDVQLVLETIATTASRLCHADHSTIFRIRDGCCHLEASEAAPDFVRYLKENPIPLDGNTVTARAAHLRRALHLPDTTKEGNFDRTIVQRSAAGTLLAVPLLA